MKKLLVLSGKGGTGKTTVAASFIRFADARAIADCDVDAPNLEIVAGQKEEPLYEDFFGMKKSSIDSEKCIGCGKCLENCRFDAIISNEDVFTINKYACEGCGVCALVCPAGAVELVDDVAGRLALYPSKVLSTARLKMGRGNSGKLVAAVKDRLYKAVPETPLAIIDGSPGIGCPVIASVSGVDLVLVVAEPSLSGFSDLERIVKTAVHLNVKPVVCVNKYDVSPVNTGKIEAYCVQKEIPFMGKIPYDKTASVAINTGKSLADFDCPARDALKGVFSAVMEELGL